MNVPLALLKLIAIVRLQAVSHSVTHSMPDLKYALNLWFLSFCSLTYSQGYTKERKSSLLLGHELFVLKVLLDLQVSFS